MPTLDIAPNKPISNRAATEENILFEANDVLMNRCNLSFDEAFDVITEFHNAGLVLRWAKWREENYPDGL